MSAASDKSVGTAAGKGSRFSGLRLDSAGEWMSPVNLHLAGVALLVLVNLYLLIHLGVACSSEHRDNADALEQQTIEMKGAEIAAQPLRGLDTKLELAGEDAEKFYHQRIPTDYSTVLSELGALANKNNVRLTRVQYMQGPAQTGGVAAGTTAEVGAEEAGLTEVRMDASLSGDYRPLVQFINGLERDKVFFLITGVTLSGQQTGVVNLRMKLTTYLRSATPMDKTDKVEQGKPGQSGPAKQGIGSGATGTGGVLPADSATATGSNGGRQP